VPTFSSPQSRHLAFLGGRTDDRWGHGTQHGGSMSINSKLVHRVCVVGAGSWGTAVAKLVAGNCKRHPEFEELVTLWVHDEKIRTFPAFGELIAAICAFQISFPFDLCLPLPFPFPLWLAFNLFSSSIFFFAFSLVSCVIEVE